MTDDAKPTDIISSLTIAVRADGVMHLTGDFRILLAFGLTEANVPFMLATLGIPEWQNWVSDFREKQRAESMTRKTRRRKAKRRRP
jgi:hypothetical protein